MAEKKSILEEALLDITNIQNALNANTKEILRSVAKEEIDGVVKESLEEKIYEEEDVESLDETSHAEHEKAESKEEEKAEHKKGEEKKEKSEMKESEEEDEEENEMNEGYEEEGLEMEDELGMGDESPEEIDMTGASDDDVIAIYKKLSGDDEIEIVGDELHLNITEPGEYVVKLDSLSDVDDTEELDVDDVDADEMGDDAEEVEYDIEMGDEDEEEDSEEGESEEGENLDVIASDEEETDEDDEDLEENIGHVNGRAGHQGQRRHGAAHLGFGKKSVDGEKLEEVQKARQIVSETAKKYNSLLTEAKKLKVENEEFRTALKEFRTKLVETVVFNSNLTYVTKLFMEHSTTKAEKQNIIKRFDEEVTNLKESKKLYKTIANELETRKPIAESVENKIIKEAATGTSKQLNESTAYVDPSTKRIMDLINRVEKRK